MVRPEFQSSTSRLTAVRYATSDVANTAPTDESEVGLSGYLPSGELHYFNAAGHPTIAYLNGDQ